MYFLNFFFFFEKNEFGDFEPEFGENLQTQKKICVRRFFLIQKTPSARIFCYQKNFCTHIFFEFSKLRFKISKLIFFEKTNRNLKNTHTQRLSLEISPNSDSKETKSRKHVFFSKTKMNLENSPNSSAEFGEFSKLRFKRFFF